MHDEHTTCIIIQFVVYPGASTRVGSKHIPGMMIPYSPVINSLTPKLILG